MTQKNSMSRRDFLKLGGLAAFSLPAANLIGKVDQYDLFESPGEYGGFLIRKLAKDTPPYQVGDSYQRFDAKNTIYGRMGWDSTLQELTQGVERSGKPTDPGWRREDVALDAASGLLAGYNGGNSGLVGKHAGLFQLDPIGAGMIGAMNMSEFKGPWDHSDKTDEDLAKMVKKAAKIYGASLVGIAPLDERWIYSGYFDLFGGGAAPIVFTDVEEVVLPEGTVSPQQAKKLVQDELSKMEPDALKTFIVETMTAIDPASLPPDAPPMAMMNAMPANQMAGMLPTMMGSMPISIITAFAKKLELGFEIALVDPGELARPRYLEDGSLAIPKTMKWVIVLGFEMDYDATEAYPTPLGMTGATNAYSRMAITAGTLAEFIRYLGYNAIPCGNNTGLSAPMAIDAGLGEVGRNGLLITPRYGPRVRLAKVITDLPMAVDQPISFGVKEFCEVCGKCAVKCPSQAIPHGPQSDQALNISTNPGVMKWQVDGEKCIVGFTMSAGDCGNCIRVCPFNKPEGWLHDATRILIGAKTGSIDSLLLKLDDASGYGDAPKVAEFWKSDNFIHIKKD